VESEEMAASFVVDLLSDLEFIQKFLDSVFVSREFGESDNRGVSPFFFESVFRDGVKRLILALSVVNEEVVGFSEDSFENVISSLEIESSALG
jgi:hypothetical protein